MNTMRPVKRRKSQTKSSPAQKQMPSKKLIRNITRRAKCTRGAIKEILKIDESINLMPSQGTDLDLTASRSVFVKNVLQDDFIPLSCNSVQPRTSTHTERNCRRISETVVSTSVVKDLKPTVTVTVNDEDEHFVDIDSDSECSSVCVDDSDSINDSVQILQETVGSCRFNAVPISKMPSHVTKTLISPSKKRTHNQSIEILECGSSSIRVTKSRDKPAVEDLTAVSSTTQPMDDDDDDDIIIVDAIENNTADSIIVLSDTKTSTETPTSRKRKRRKERLRENKRRKEKSPELVVFHDGAGNNQDSARPCKSPLLSTPNRDDTANANGSYHQDSARPYKSPLLCIPNRDDIANANGSYHNVFGNNIYNPNRVQKSGLRPIIIDGSNVAYGHGGNVFSVRGILICVNYFIKRGHSVTTFVPGFRRSGVPVEERRIFDDLESKRQLVFTPSRFLHGRRVASYDDRFIVQCAAELGGIIVSRDNYRDLVHENEAWRETIEKRLLMFTWVGDILMFPDDPNGRGGPRLEEFLRFP